MGWFIFLGISLGMLLHSGTVLAAEPVRKEKPKPLIEARLIVSDSGALFSAEAIKKAKATVTEVKDHNPREMTILTFKEMPEEKKKAYDKLGKDDSTERTKIFRDWAIAEAKDDRAKGLFVLICRSPGYVEILTDKAVRDKGFSARDEEHLRDLFLTRFREARDAKQKDKSEEEQQTIRDKGLLEAVEFVKDAYKKMVR